MRLCSLLRQKPIYDVIVVGGGHAGCEAAAASARTGSRTLLMTHKLDTIGEMSCNPSFGGIGKGHLVREVDALDGVCARICDISGCHYKVLNRSKGPAVYGLRAQIDRKLYKQNMQKEMFSVDKLTIQSGAVEDLHFLDASFESSNNKPTVGGVVLQDGSIVRSKAVVITTGTFLKGEIYLGLDVKPAGRIGDDASYGLSHTLDRLGFRLGRLRTGTPPRLSKRTVRFDGLNRQDPDREPEPFSFMNESVWVPFEKQLPCFMTFTNEKVAKIVKESVHLTQHVPPDANAPRYCPSLETKIVRFGDKKEHQIWLEPEGFDSDLVYPQGCSMFYPVEVQEKVIRSMQGLENAEIVRPGYGVQYDFVDPRQLKVSFETKLVNGLFLAGQINGTTGYEEAAAQGIVAGINAALYVQQRDPLILTRADSYIGVLIDDLTSLGTNEPYRMFTSRAEFRLYLRPDNADLRLTQLVYEHGAISPKRYDAFLNAKSKFELALSMLTSYKKALRKWKEFLPALTYGKGANEAQTFDALHVLLNYNLQYDETLERYGGKFAEFVGDKRLKSRLISESLYRRFVNMNEAEMESVRKDANLLIPEGLDYEKMSNSISYECREKFDLYRPQTIGAASRIPGVTPSALVSLLRFVKQRPNGSRSVEVAGGVL